MNRKVVTRFKCKYMIIMELYVFTIDTQKKNASSFLGSKLDNLIIDFLGLPTEMSEMPRFGYNCGIYNDSIL